jgi:hypothetical protein
VGGRRGGIIDAGCESRQRADGFWLDGWKLSTESLDSGNGKFIEADGRCGGRNLHSNFMSAALTLSSRIFQTIFLENAFFG